MGSTHVSYTFWCSVSTPELLRCGSPSGLVASQVLPFIISSPLTYHFLKIPIGHRLRDLFTKKKKKLLRQLKPLPIIIKEKEPLWY
jgi:hypothetical protein